MSELTNIEDHIGGFPESWKILARAIDGYLKEYDPDYVIDQVKEKFGGMRYYFHFVDDVDNSLSALGQAALQERVRQFANLSYYMEQE